MGSETVGSGDSAGLVVEGSGQPVIDEHRAKEICQVFAKVHTSTAVKLARGAAERNRIFESLRKTGACQSYRLDWLQAAVHKCVGQMANAAQEFNDNHSFDQCSVQDLIDILEMAAEKLRGA